MSRGVFVLGMHRSGTSAATRLVNLLGVPLCVEDDLLAGTKDNPRGYWESGSLTAFNDRIFGMLESDWRCPPALAPGWETDPALGELLVEAGELFDRVCPSEQWVWKDPRNCMTFPFWLDCLDVDPAIVLVHRNPLEIVASLAARDDLGKVYGLALWERYLRTCLAASSGLPTLVTTYDEILDDPLAWCGRIEAFLADAGVATRPVVADGVLGFIGRELRHSTFAPEQMATDPAVSSAQRALFLVLEGLVGARNTLSLPDLPPETLTTEALLAERRRRYPREREHQELGEYARNLGDQFVELERRYVELQRDSEGTWEQFLELKRYSDDLGERFLALEEYARDLQRKTGIR
jgi:hypothetical protein